MRLWGGRICTYLLNNFFFHLPQFFFIIFTLKIIKGKCKANANCEISVCREIKVCLNFPPLTSITPLPRKFKRICMVTTAFPALKFFCHILVNIVNMSWRTEKVANQNNNGKPMAWKWVAEEIRENKFQQKQCHVSNRGEKHLPPGSTMYFVFIKKQQWQFCSQRLANQIQQHKSKQFSQITHSNDADSKWVPRISFRCKPLQIID